MNVKIFTFTAFFFVDMQYFYGEKSTRGIMCFFKKKNNMTPKEADFFAEYIDMRLQQIVQVLTQEQSQKLVASTFADRYMQAITGQQALPQATFRQFLEELSFEKEDYEELFEKLEKYIQYDEDTKTLTLMNGDGSCTKCRLSDSGFEVVKCVENGLSLSVYTDVDAAAYNADQAYTDERTWSTIVASVITNKTDDSLEDNEVVVTTQNSEHPYEAGGKIGLHALSILNIDTVEIESVEEITYEGQTAWKLTLADALDYNKTYAKGHWITIDGIRQYLKSLPRVFLRYIYSETETTLMSVDASGNMIVAGTVTINDEVEINSNATISGDVEISGVSNLGDDLIVSGGVYAQFYKATSGIANFGYNSKGFSEADLRGNATVVMGKMYRGETGTEDITITLAFPSTSGIVDGNSLCYETELLIHNANGVDIDFVAPALYDIWWVNGTPTPGDTSLYSFKSIKAGTTSGTAQAVIIGRCESLD